MQQQRVYNYTERFGARGWLAHATHGGIERPKDGEQEAASRIAVTKPTCEHGLEVVAGRSHHRSVNRKHLVTISGNKCHVAKQTFHSQLVKTLQEERNAKHPFDVGEE